MTTDNEKIVIKADFNPIVRTYILFYVFFILFITIVGIPMAIIWLCGVGQWYSRHFYEKLYCILSEKHLRFRLGILFTVDKTIPLENIQDLTFIEGPVLRYFNLSMLKVETAGQSTHTMSGNQLKLVGIVDANVFRNKVLEHRERVKMNLTPGFDKQIELLEKIAESLEKIQEQLAKK